MQQVSAETFWLRSYVIVFVRVARECALFCSPPCDTCTLERNLTHLSYAVNCTRAVAPAILENKVTGKYYHPIARETVPDPHARNPELQARLWKMSEEFVATHPP